MADNYDVQVTLQGISHLSEDRFVNTLHFHLGDSIQIGQDPNFSDFANELWSKYDILRPSLGGLAQDGHKISIYEPGINASGPKYEVMKAFPGEVGAAGPTEIALCLSYATVDNPDASTPRRRGRIFIGPLSSSVTGTTRPAQGLRNTLLDFGQGLAEIGTANLTTWKQYSLVDNVYTDIESIWVDDAWDSQRRRGLKPTIRDKRDVQ